MRIDLSTGVPVSFLRADVIRAAIVSAANIAAAPASPYLVKRWLDRDGISLVYGKSNVGKTFFAVDIAFHVGAGSSWNGCRVRQGRVLYVAAEGQGSVARRFLAVQRGKPDLHAAAREHVDLLPLRVDLHGPEDAQAIIQASGERGYALIVIDTLARSFGAGDENASNDMGAFIANIAALKDHFGGHVMIVHHEGKDSSRGARGHSSLRAAVDTEIALKADGLIKSATLEKQRDGATGLEVAYTLDVIPLGYDEDGDVIDSCVVQPTDVKLARRKTRPTGRTEVALQALHEALRRHGRIVPSGDNYPTNRRIVSIDQWRHEAQRMGIGDGVDGDAARKRFERARDWLLEHDFIRVFDRNTWLIDEDPDGQRTGADADAPVPDIHPGTDGDSSPEGCPLSRCPDPET
ncbi:MAG: helicase RepA family protein [Rhodobacteraceae bacterium]|nr:helicase RepA family protein [Paracoccaceae bacterium]